MISDDYNRLLAQQQRSMMNDLARMQQMQGIAQIGAQLLGQCGPWVTSAVGCTAGIGTSWPSSARAERKRFPRDDYARQSIWRRRMLRLKEKRWEKRQQWLGEVAWKLGLGWGAFGVLAVTTLLMRAIIHLVFG